MGLLRFAALAAVASMAAAPATAGVLFIEASGVVASGYDPNDILGAPKDEDGVYHDVAFSLSMTYDLGNALIEDQSGTNVALGGTLHGAPTVALVTFTIGGVAYQMVGAEQSDTLQNLQVVQQGLGNGLDLLLLGADYHVDTLSPFVDAPPAGNICATASCYGNFRLSNLIDGMLYASNYTITYDAEATPPEIPCGPGGGPVPEPSTWALMIAGFGLAGSALRRRGVAA